MTAAACKCLYVKFVKMETVLLVDLWTIPRTMVYLINRESKPCYQKVFSFDNISRWVRNSINNLNGVSNRILWRAILRTLVVCLPNKQKSFLFIRQEGITLFLVMAHIMKPWNRTSQDNTFRTTTYYWMILLTNWICL